MAVEAKQKQTKKRKRVEKDVMHSMERPDEVREEGTTGQCRAEAG